MSKANYTFTCDGCKKTFPMRKVSAMVAWHCRECAIARWLLSNTNQHYKNRGYKMSKCKYSRDLAKILKKT